MSIFKNYTSQKPQALLLKAGDHRVRIAEIVMTNSFTQYNGSQKEDTIWSEPTDQIMFKLQNEQGTIVFRANGAGYVHIEDLSPDQIKKQKLVEMKGFAAKELPDGTFERIVSEERSQACINILNKIMWAAQFEEGATIEDLFSEAVGREMNIHVAEDDTYDGKNRLEVKRFWRVNEGEAIAADAETALG